MGVTLTGNIPLDGLVTEQELKDLFELVKIVRNGDMRMLAPNAQMQFRLESTMYGEVTGIGTNGENIVVDNMISGESSTPVSTRIKDQMVPANQDATGLLGTSYKVHADNCTFTPSGTIAASGSVPAQGTGTLQADNDIYSYRVVLEEELTDTFVILEGFYGTDATGDKFAERRIPITGAVAVGSTLDLPLRPYIEVDANVNVFVRVLKADNSVLQVRPVEESATDPYFVRHHRSFVRKAIPEAADDISVDTTALSNVTSANLQELAAYVDGLPTSSGVTINMGGVEVATEITTINITGGATVTDNGSGVATINVVAGGTEPMPSATDIRFGISDQSAPALVDFASLTDVANPTNPQTVATGAVADGQYFHIFNANTHPIQTILDTILNQNVYQRGGTGNIFAYTADSRVESGVTYNNLVIGPLNATAGGESYVVGY